MPQSHKVEELLSRDELNELEAFAREPGRTVDELHEWLQVRGFTMARSSAGRWKQSFDERQLRERMTAASGLAKAYEGALRDAKKDGGLQMADTAIEVITQKLFEAALSEEDPSKLATLALASQRLTLSKKHVEDVRREFVDREKQAITAAREVAKGGGSGEAVVNRVREILGIT